MKNSENKEIVTVMGEKWEKENLEWFKKALIEGVNNRIQREIDKCDDTHEPVLK